MASIKKLKKPTCPYCNEAMRIRKYGFYEPKIKDLVEGEKVQRFICVSCNRLFSDMTVKKGKSPYVRAVENRKIEDVDYRLAKHGVENIEIVKENLKMGAKAYYRRRNIVLKRTKKGIALWRKEIGYKKCLLLEYVIRTPLFDAGERKTGRKLERYFLLVDKETKVVMNVIMINEKSQFSWRNNSTQDLSNFRQEIGMRWLHRIFEWKKWTDKSFSVELNCSPNVTEQLLAKNAKGIFSVAKKRESMLIRKKLEKYGINKIGRLSGDFIGVKDKQTGLRSPSWQHIYRGMSVSLSLYNHSIFSMKAPFEWIDGSWRDVNKEGEK